MPPKVRDIQKRIEEDGWVFTGIRGVIATSFIRRSPVSLLSLVSRPKMHKKEPTKYLETGRAGEVKEYAVIYEQGPNGWGAYAPDLPGLGAAGKTFEEVEQLIREDIKLHIECLRETGNAVPEPTTRVASVAIAA